MTIISLAYTGLVKLDREWGVCLLFQRPKFYFVCKNGRAATHNCDSVVGSFIMVFFLVCVVSFVVSFVCECCSHIVV